MSNAAATTDNSVRPLRPADLERVIAIDLAHVGEPRRRFFEKRLAHAKQHPEDIVHVGVVRKGALVGFAFARILRGEFGREQAIATLDAVGVEHDSREHGVGHALMDGLTKVMRAEGRAVSAIAGRLDQSRSCCGFSILPVSDWRRALVLERSVLTPLAESVDEE